ncbi:hypothetical protein NQ317_015007 [Molorchus minor]|uniref:Uncharacterized protein n=1 Tax=Molorchus minor TaxID=1323400 RepID=A0ABQ9K4V3_9CUCU|nr:hypothetical protein NQ317_015007 [Molorchus minor]
MKKFTIKLYNNVYNINCYDVDDNNNDNNEITKDEVLEAIKSWKNGKTPGYDRMMSEMLKNMGERYKINCSHPSCNVCYIGQSVLKMAIYIAETCPRCSKFNVSLLTGGDL